LEIILIIPFILLVLAIAVLPFVNEKWWLKNYAIITIILSLFIIIYYSLFGNEPGKLIQTFEDYFSFITLLFSLYVVSGGIFLKIRGKSTPIKNVLILAVGSVIANIFGTTGAAMLLIKPFIESNKYRIKSYHIIFFIFLVCNVGGALTPIGDPPLLLGYIKGIPFFWVTEHLFLYWILTIGYLLLIFFLIDLFFYRRINKKEQTSIKEKGENISAEGLYNLIFLVIIVASVFITKPFLLREIIILLCAYFSYKVTPGEVHKRNNFLFNPIKEVAILFAGIFITLIPVIEFLGNNSTSLGLKSHSDFYWATGIFTAFLDNAPTYLNFLSVSMGLNNLSINNINDVTSFLSSNPFYIISISVSSVFFGALTYIGNGPNLLVKSISEHKGIKLPGFFGYLFKYSLVILLPFYFILWLLFFR
jgi:Na+/H+ antiporter NhaD/arsenite permease-like protein